MASGDSSNRFNPFKFTAPSASPKPPPLPPKDYVYRTPATPGPASPLSPTPAPPQPPFTIVRTNSPLGEDNGYSIGGYSSSTPSLLSPPMPRSMSMNDANVTATTSVNTNGKHQSAAASKKDKALAFLKFPKRSPRTPPAASSSGGLASRSGTPTAVIVIGNPNSGVGDDDDDPPPPQEDDGISLPWNFQHNIHVDEGYVGIPPSWSTSLASAGFTEEEIAAIHARRALRAVPVPDHLNYLYNERPSSPSVSQGPSSAQYAYPPASTSQGSAVPVLKQPMPRSTSLHRLGRNGGTEEMETSQPVLASINTGSTSNSNSNPSASASTPTTSTSTRRPPPRRKPPLPVELDESAEVQVGTGFPAQSTLVQDGADPAGREILHGRNHKPNASTSATDASVGREPRPEERSDEDILDEGERKDIQDGVHDDTTTSTSFSHLNNSAAYKYNPDILNDSHSSTNQAQNPVYTRPGAFTTTSDADTDSDDDTPLAPAPYRLGSESGTSGGAGRNNGVEKYGGPGGNKRFKVINASSSVDSGIGEAGITGESLEGGTDMEIDARSSPYTTQSGTGSGLGSTASEKEVQKKPSIWGTKINKSKSKESDVAPYGSSSVLTEPSASFSRSAVASTSTWKANTSNTIAHASSSLAQASSSLVSKGSTLVDVVRSSAGRGVMKIKMRSGSAKEGANGVKKRSRSKDSAAKAKMPKKGGTEEGDDEEDMEGSDEEFASMPSPGDELQRPMVWERYTRPRAGTDASERGSGFEVKVNTVTKSSDLVEGQPSSSTITQSKPYKLRTGPTSIVPLRRQPSVRSQASSSSSLRTKMKGQSASMSSLAQSLRQNRSTGSLRSMGKHKQSGSMTSLESIPEVSSPPPVPDASPYKWNKPSIPSTFVRDADTSMASTVSSSADVPLPIKKTPALPPRLSLHQYSDSSDLSSWSEALLSGISMTGGGESKNKGEGLSFGLGLDLDFGSFGMEDKDQSKIGPLRRPTELDKEPMSAPATATATMTARPWAIPQSQTQLQQQQQRQVNKSATPPQRSALHIRKAGQQLPTSKPPPNRPIPSINATSSSSSLSSDPRSTVTTQNNTRTRSRSRSHSRTRPLAGSSLSEAQSGWDDTDMESPIHVTSKTEIVPSLPIPSVVSSLSSGSTSSLPPTTPLSARANKPLPPIADGEMPPAYAPRTAADGLLSPPPSAWSAAADGVTSPAGSSAGPDSAQLWNEIEQMMDPGMMKSIPGLHLSMALPPGAHGVLRSAGLGPGQQGQMPSPLVLPPVGLAAVNETSASLKTVGDLVGTSPTYSAALTETFSATLPFTPEEDRMAAQRKLRAGEGVLGTKEAVAGRGRQRHDDQQDFPGDVDQDDDNESEYSSEHASSIYDGIEDDDSQIQKNGSSPQVRATSYERGGSRKLLGASRSRERGNLSVDAQENERDPNRNSSRSSSSTLTVTAMATTTIVRNVSVARRAGAYVIDKRRMDGSRDSDMSGISQSSPTTPNQAFAPETKHPSSPLSSHFGGTGSEESGGSSGSFSSSSQDQELQATPTTTDGGIASPLLYYLDGTQTPSPTPDKVMFDKRQQMPNPLTHKNLLRTDEENLDEEPFAGYPDEETMEAEAAAAAAVASPNRPTIVISDVPLSGGSMPMPTNTSTPGTSTPLSPFQRYRGWLSAVVAPLEEFIDESVDPRDHYLDLNEIAEGESGSVFASVLNPETAHKLRLPPLIKAKDADEIMAGRTVLVAIKSVAIVPSGSPKLVDLQRELTLMRGLGHENILGMDGVYVDLLEDSLWVRMELMERSLADIIQLVDNGLQLQERTIARFASDILCALEFLQKHNIAHRDVRSDNLLLNKHGVLKLADFSNAVQVTRESPMRTDIVGVAFWQAPEVRKPPYDSLKVDVWSLGATVWEMAQQDPPFADTQQLADRWPPLRQPELFSPAFHDFLRRCSEPASVRPSPSELLKSSLIVHKACGRQVIVLLLSQCMAIEKQLQENLES